MQSRVLSLNSASLAETDLRRDLPADFHAEPDVIAEHYDDTTLWYDAIWTGRQLVLITPKLFNLEPLFRTGLALDGQPTRPSRIRHRRAHSEVWLKPSRRPETVSVTIEGTEITSSVSRTESDLFKNQNVWLTLQKNNDLDWIRDFLIYHRARHGLQAVMVFDNASDEYGLDALEETFADAGLTDCLLVQAPFRYGLNAKRSSGVPHWEGMPLQPAVLNIARFRFLARARAVLHCDIDELIWCKNEQSIFDLTRRHPLGYVQIPMQWRHAKVAEGVRPRHGDHVWMRPGGEPSPPKWCLNPRGPLFWASWDVHKLDGLGMRDWQMSRRAGAWHLRQLTTNWKPHEGRLFPPVDLVEDGTITAALAASGLQERTTS